MKLVVTIPALNEQESIGRVVREIPRRIVGISEVEVVVMNDGSTDATAAVARAAGANVVTLPGKRGLGHVFRCSMTEAIRRKADLIVNIDGDGQFDSADVARIIQPILHNQADFVTCTRFAEADGPRGMTSVKFWGNRSVTWLVNRLAKLDLSDVSCGFRAYNREAAYRLSQFGRWTYVEECLLDLAVKKMRIVQLPFTVRGQREHGESRVARNVVRYGSNLLQILLRALRDIYPLRFFCSLAAICFGVGMIGVGFLALWLILHGQTSPFTSLVPMSMGVLVLAFLLLMVGLIADMVARHRRLNEELLYLARRKLFAAAPAAVQPPPLAPATLLVEPVLLSLDHAPAID